MATAFLMTLIQMGDRCSEELTLNLMKLRQELTMRIKKSPRNDLFLGELDVYH
jgi:hypothetical protein